MSQGLLSTIDDKTFFLDERTAEEKFELNKTLGLIQREQKWISFSFNEPFFQWTLNLSSKLFLFFLLFSFFSAWRSQTFGFRKIFRLNPMGFHPKMLRKFLGPGARFSKDPELAFPDSKAIFSSSGFKTETCIRLNLLVWPEPLFILNTREKKTAR